MNCRHLAMWVALLLRLLARLSGERNLKFLMKEYRKQKLWKKVHQYMQLFPVFHQLSFADQFSLVAWFSFRFVFIFGEGFLRCCGVGGCVHIYIF